MTTYQTATVWTQISEAKELSPKVLGYFQARLKNKLHELVLTKFMECEKNGFTRSDMARRIHKKPEQITRLLGAPGNWTLETVSDLLLAMGYELSLQTTKFDEPASSSYFSMEPDDVRPFQRHQLPTHVTLTSSSDTNRTVASAA